MSSDLDFLKRKTCGKASKVWEERKDSTGSKVWKQQLEDISYSLKKEGQWKAGNINVDMNCVENCHIINPHLYSKCCNFLKHFIYIILLKFTKSLWNMQELKIFTTLLKRSKWDARRLNNLRCEERTWIFNSQTPTPVLCQLYQWVSNNILQVTKKRLHSVWFYLHKVQEKAK